MARLTKKQMAELSYILRNLQRGWAYIQQPGITVARRCAHSTTTLHWTRSNTTESLYEIDKQIGSDLTGVGNGIVALERFLAQGEEG